MFIAVVADELYSNLFGGSYFNDIWQAIAN